MLHAPPQRDRADGERVGRPPAVAAETLECSLDRGPFLRAEVERLAQRPAVGVRDLRRQIARLQAAAVGQDHRAFDGVFDDLPAVLVAHNVEYRSAEENAAAAQGFQRVVYTREARALKDMEAKLCAKARFVFTLAEEDRVALGVASDDRSAVLPLVTRPKPPALAGRTIACDAALIGTWTWQPNRIGLDWFLGSVVPHLPPAFSIRIAGHMPADVTSTHPGVAFVGRVPDAEQFVRTAAVVPLISQAGTGVQLKTIETFELGLPSVATRRSLRGIDFLPPNCVVEDDPKAFAAALVAAARERRPAIDGAVFHRRQLKALDAAILRGLKVFREARAEAAA